MGFLVTHFAVSRDPAFLKMRNRVVGKTAFGSRTSNVSLQWATTTEVLGGSSWEPPF